MTAQSELRANVSFRLPMALLQQVDERVKQMYPLIQSRTHLMEIALTEYLAKPAEPPKK